MSLISFAKTWAAGDVLYAADLEAMKAAIVAVVNGGIDDSNVVASANIDPGKIGDYSADDTEMQTQTDPFPSSVISKPTTLEGEFARLRFMLKTVLGTTYWYQSSVTGVKVHTTGDLKWTIKTSADTGWVLMNDGTIGNAASGGTTRANADTVDLYTLIYTNFSDALCPVSTGRGANAAADYAANKTIRLPLATGRLLGVAGNAATANVDAATTYAANSGADSTHILMDPHLKFLQNDQINGYIVTVTSGARSGETSVVTDYVASTGILTISPALTGVIGVSTFTLHQEVTTRSLGDTVGITAIQAVGSITGSTGGGEDFIGGFGNTSLTAGVGTHTGYPPSWFGNLMVKL